MSEKNEWKPEVSAKKSWKRPAVILGALSLALCGSASATGGDLPAGSSGLDTVMEYMDEVTTLCTQVWSMLTSNAYFAMFLAIGLLSAGIGIFRRVKRAARR